MVILIMGVIVVTLEVVVGSDVCSLKALKHSSRLQAALIEHAISSAISCEFNRMSIG